MMTKLIDLFGCCMQANKRTSKHPVIPKEVEAMVDQDNVKAEPDKKHTTNPARKKPTVNPFEGAVCPFRNIQAPSIGENCVSLKSHS